MDSFDIKTENVCDNAIGVDGAADDALNCGDALKERTKGRFFAFFKKSWTYFLAPVAIFIIFFSVLAAYNVYPFSKTSMSNYDLLAQICPFIEHFYDVFDGKSSLFYSTAIMGGADVFGTLAYCCVSPFTFLFLLFGKGNVYYAVSFVLPIKLSCIALSAIYFIKSRFSSIPDHVGLILALLYAYCGYTFVANTYINWMDFLIYMPFVVTGFIKLVSEKKIRYFAVSYALMIYTCFSIASFALLLVYLIFVLYVFICVDRTERKETLFRICLSLVLAVAIALPIMIPSFIAYTRSGRNTGLFENMANELSDKHLKIKLSYIISDACCLLFTIIYFLKTKLKTKESVFYLVTGVLILMPVLVDEVCNLLNAGSYMSYALRFGFLNSTYALYLCCKLLEGVKNEKIPLKKSIISTVLFGVAAAAAAVGIILYHLSVVESGNDKFSGEFAHSLGGLSVISVISAIVVGLIIIALILYKLKLSPFKALSLITSAVLITQITVLNVYLVKGNIFDPVRYEQYNYISSVIKQNYESEGDGYYRIKDYDDAISNAAPLTTHTNCFSVFSSVIDATNLAATNFFGYGGNKINCIKSKGGLYFGDALLGYKYYYIHNDSYRNQGKNSHASENRSYNTLLDDTIQPYFQGVRNELCFPNAFTTLSGDMVFDGDYYANMTKLYNFLGGEGELFDLYDIKTSNVIYDADKKTYMVKVYAVDEGQWYLKADFPEKFDVHYSTSAYSEEDNKILSGDSVINFNYHKKATGTYYYCYFKSYGETMTAEDVISCCKGACLPLYKLSELKESLSSRAVQYKIVNGNRFEVKANAETDCEYLFLNYVALKGFDIKVNGKKTEFVDNGLNFMIVKLDKGENDVTITYNSPYVLYALIGVIITVAIGLAVFKISRSGKKFRSVAIPVAYFSAIVLAIAVFGFFIGYPTVVFLKKLLVFLF